MTDKNRVVVLGCGLGGLVVASSLAKQAKGAADIVAVERKTRFQFPASYPWVVMGSREPEQVERDLAGLSRKKVKLVNDTVSKIDVKARRVETKSAALEYDHLVIALGAEYAPGTVPGFVEHAFQFYDLDSAVKLRDRLESFDGRTVTVGVSRTPFKCPAAPYEMSLLLDDRFRRAKKNVKIQLFTPEAHPVPAAGPVIGKQVERMLAERGIAYSPKKKVVKVESDGVMLEDGERLDHDLFVGIPPHACPKVVVEAGLTGPEGWVPVNPNTLLTRFEDVYAIGDVAGVETPHGHMPFLPKAGVFARGQGEVVANNIAVAVTGKGERKAWDGTGICYLEVSRSESALVRGSFLAKPPRLELHPPRRKWHLERVALEKFWMKHWF